MVLTCESMFSRTSLDANKPKIYTAYLHSRASKIQLHLPFGYNLQILLARGNGQAPMLSPGVSKIEKL